MTDDEANAQRLWLTMLKGNEPDGDLLEIRCKPIGQSLRRAGFCPSVKTAIAAVNALADRGDVYVGVAPRRETYRLRDHKQSGGLDSIARVWVIFADADTPRAADSLRTFASPPATALVRSGRGLHGYWALKRPLTPAKARQANRRLALYLDCDMNATDAARIMRPPATFNHKTKPPSPVTCERLDLTVYHARDVVGELPDPPEPTPPMVLTRRASGDTNVLVDGAARVVRDAEPGNRNAALNWAAFTLGKRVADGELDEATVESVLYDAAVAAGLVDAEIATTIGKGLRDACR